MKSILLRCDLKLCVVLAATPIWFLLLTLLAASLSGVSSATENTNVVKIGYCAPLAELDGVKAAGFDYVELRTSEIAGLTDEDYQQLAAKLKRFNLPVPTTYLFIPANIKLTGPHTDHAQQAAYVQKAFDRVSRLGVHTVVLGSGPARTYPAGFSKSVAFQQLVEFCKWLGPEARTHGITIAIEPLRKEESNIINNMAEGLQLVKAVADPNIQLNLDYYHLAMEKEDPAIILEAKNYIRHVHTANPNGRVFPLNWDEYDYGPFYAALRKIGYQGEVSIEAHANDFQKEAPQSIALLRRALSTQSPKP
ncbi:MAG: hypothetical protein NVS9B4_04690 [Candidatus Acidiferrum sp.]